MFESPAKKQKLSAENEDSKDCTEMLSDEILLDIVTKCVPEAKTLAQASGVNRRFRNLHLQKRVMNQILDSRVEASHRDLFSASTTECSRLEELAFYQQVAEKGFFKENRIGFDFASTDIDDDNGEASLIKGSTSRIESLGGILERFKNASLIVEAHCGTAAPPGIAPRFSRIRGQVVCSEVSHSDYSIPNLSERITMNPWGRRVAQRASLSDHDYGEVARDGRGWVEVYLVLGELELPRRPQYYNGLRVDEEDEERIRIIGVRY